MVAPAIGLDDEAVGREEEVDLVRVVVGVGDDVIAQRLWQTGTAAQGAEAALQLAAREGRVIGRGRAQGLCSAATAVAFEHVEDRAVVVELVAEGLAEGVLEVAPRCGGREVEEGPREAGDRDASVGGGIAGIEASM